MRRRVLSAIAASALATTLLLGPASGKVPNPFTEVPDSAFSPVIYPSAFSESLRTSESEPPAHRDFPKPKPSVALPPPVPTAPVKAVVKATPRPAVGGNGTIIGKASWYCSPAKPICHYAYPPGSMVAAACGKLRRAMGPNWRGQYVEVENLANERTETVRLVDWCGSEDKTIDLYWAPMSKLGGTGVLTVRVTW